MGQTYWITGVQLGMLLAYTQDTSFRNEAKELIDGVINNQETDRKARDSHKR